MSVEIGVFLTFGGALILLFLLGRTLLIPVKFLLRLLLNSLLGGVFLVVLHFLGAQIGIVIPLNVANAMTVGILGVPGMILLILFCN